MHLKSLTLKGFKSFASATTLQFEPGITCVVGPNGSGKSNVIDAVAWVLGEQGARSLRGGSMADVIFAGTSGRAPLGRAEVTLTIDNSDGAVPIPHAEITLRRTMFRGGGSEYSINGSSARLLDVVELLSDAGVGREMHVIVGQNSLDTVLAGSPMDRRGLLEEAAGVLKHRKRKEKALRKLEAMQANLARIQDLTAEVRRQLTPLGRQAQAAQKAVVLQADLRDSTLRLLADDLVRAGRAVAEREAAESEARERRARVDAELDRVRARVRAAEQVVSTSAERLSQASGLSAEYGSLRERLKGTAALAQERQRSAEQLRATDVSGLRDPAELEREAEEARRQETELRVALEEGQERLTAATSARQAAEAELERAEKQASSAARAAADAREQRARLAGDVAAVRGRLETREAELLRLRAAAEEARERASALRARAEELQQQVSSLDEDETRLNTAYEQAESVCAALEEQVADVARREREAERARAAAGARGEALRLALASRLSADAADLPEGMAGPRLSDVLMVEAGYQAAIAAALGAAAESATVADVDTAARALSVLRESGSGGASFVVVGGSSSNPSVPTVGAAPAGCRPALDLVTVQTAYSAVVGRLLSSIVVADSTAYAVDAVATAPELVVVTLEGDVYEANAVRGAAGESSALELQAAATEAENEEAAAAATGLELVREREGLEAEVREARVRADTALDALHESDASLAAVAEQLGQWGASARAAEGEADRADEAAGSVEAALQADRTALPELEQRLAGVDEGSDPADAPDDDRRTELAQACVTARQAELDARLAVRVTEERIAVEARRSAAAARAAEQQIAARAEAERRRARAEHDGAVAAAVIRGAAEALVHLERVADEVAARLRSLREEQSSAASELTAARNRLREVEGEAEALRSGGSAGEMARIEARVRLETLEVRAREEFALEPEPLIAQYGPEVPVPVQAEGASGADDDDAGAEAPTEAYDRQEQEQRRRAAEKALNALGKVNPLALEEFAALEERHKFLSTQLEDLKATRKDLMELVDEVDAKVQEIFADAFADTAREFERVFSRLFPGGEGRLVLSNPDDPLTTGIEVEARPPGKRVKRLSLLSGGERSLTALAFLVALFQARPSPFYILDEVEAALDDVNLGRLLGLLEELRGSSQLIVITHQKRTMEIADALYGVSMRGDGVSAVIGQRLREPQPA